MIARTIVRGGTALGFLLSAPALAQQGDAGDSAAPRSQAEQEAEQLRQEMTELQSRLQRLETQIADQQNAIATAQSTSSTALAQAQAAEKAAGETKVTWKGAPELSTKSGWSFKPRGRLQYDFGSVSAPKGISDPGLGFSNELRRVRLGAEGTIPGGFGYRFELEFANGGAELWDAYITYKTGGLTVTAGQHNTFQSLDELTSSNDTVFIERAAFTDAFNFERRLGLSAQYAAGPLLLQGGVFTDNTADLSDDGNNAVSFDGRVVYAPKLGSTQLHLAASAHWRDLGDTIDSGRYRQRPLIHSTDIRFIDTGNLPGARSETDYGLEALAISGRFHTAGEAHWLKLSRGVGSDPGFFGGYAEIGYFLTDDSYGYRGGVLRAPKVRNPVGSGGIGAIALDVRYDRLDLNDASAGVRGGKQDGYIAGISWWPVDYLRFMVNYAHLVYGDAAIPAAGGDRSYSADVVGGRVQVSF
jgi:phosphate-selective porin OprO/OprP